MAWNKNYENRDIYALMSELNEMEVHERVAFLQQFLRAEPLSPLYDGVFPPRSAFVPTIAWEPEQDCRCRVMRVAASRNVVPVRFIADGIIYPRSTSYEPVPKHTFHENRGEIWINYAFAGPARFNQMMGQTRRCRTRTEMMRWSGVSPRTGAGRMDSIFVYSAELRYGQGCHDANWHPTSCQCTQEIDIEWRYDAMVSARSETLDRACFYKPGKSAWAVADDACIVAIHRPNTQRRMFPLGFSRATASSSCAVDFQEERLVDLLKLGFAIFSLKKGGGPTTGYPGPDSMLNFIWVQHHKNSLEDILRRLLTQPWEIKRGTCETSMAFARTSGDI